MAETLDERLDQQHREDVLAQDQAGGVLIAIGRVERKAHGRKEGDRARQRVDRQVDEDLRDHVAVSRGVAIRGCGNGR
ncbi:hypothetical protein NO430_18955 [Xanthomonas oryzae pv. oryzae]|nr:hypothetical protein [Xanthomonas oryzae]UWI58925.1 hypothetical protein NO430_18955 [Xanthomonas oryzae pv. oryzae]